MFGETEEKRGRYARVDDDLDFLVLPCFYDTVFAVYVQRNPIIKGNRSVTSGYFDLICNIEVGATL